MSTLTLGPRLFDPARVLFDEPAVESGPRAQPGLPPGYLAEPEGRPTLDDVIVAGWQQITSGAAASCPVCHGELRPVWTAGTRPVAARCQDCGSRLS
jgi:hypothetical protein